jgi:hypothetical protein
MNIQESAAVLAKIKVGDNREVDQAGLVLREWHETLKDLPYGDAVEAVNMHRRSSDRYLMPAHIVENVRIIQARREREQRASRPKQIEPNRITLDRAAFEAETRQWIEHYREERARENR